MSEKTVCELQHEVVETKLEKIETVFLEKIVSQDRSFAERFASLRVHLEDENKKTSEDVKSLVKKVGVNGDKLTWVVSEVDKIGVFVDKENAKEIAIEAKKLSKLSARRKFWYGVGWTSAAAIITTLVGIILDYLKRGKI